MRNRWYLAFVGLSTIPIAATSIAEARGVVIDEYAARGIALANREVRVRRARSDDAGWLRDMGAREIADALASVGVYE